MADITQRKETLTVPSGTLQRRRDEHPDQILQLGHQLESIRMRVEQEEASSDMASKPKTKNKQPLERLDASRTPTSGSSQGAKPHRGRRSRTPLKVTSPTTATFSPRLSKRYSRNKSSHAGRSRSRGSKPPQANIQTEISSASSPNSQDESGTGGLFSSPEYRTSETSSRSQTSLPGQQSSIYPHSPTRSTGNRHDPRRAQGFSKVKRREMILSKNNWRRIDTPSLRSPVPEPVMKEFVPPKDEDVKAVMKIAADNVSEKMRKIVSVVLQQQAALDPGKINPFRPSYPALQRMNLLPGLDEYRSSVSASVFGVSKNYLGDLSVPENHCANIPENQNCSLWLMGLPADVTYTTLLHSIRGVGKVYATWINHASEQHRSAAAKVVLFDRRAAETLFKMIENGNFLVQGTPILARWNRIKAAKYPRPEQSRVIRITGPAKLMDFDFFQTYFETLFTFQLDKRIMVPCSIKGMASHEWHFGSLRCQSQHAKLIIERELQPTFSVQWACDPCEHS